MMSVIADFINQLGRILQRALNTEYRQKGVLWGKQPMIPRAMEGFEEERI